MDSVHNKHSIKTIKLGFRKSLAVLWPYLRSKIMLQVKSVWFIITYLIVFQIFILKLPIVYSLMISAGVLLVIFGLTLFMEGLDIGLMPFGNVIGSNLPKKSSLIVIMIFSVLLGIGATLAEPAIAVLKTAGSRVSPLESPLLYSLLNEFSGQLVASVGLGVGIAVLLGVLRFLYSWSLKTLIIPSVSLLLILTIYAHFNDILQDILGLAWDCGAVTTGPVTVPLVLALGLGVCRVVSNQDSEGASGFGIVTLASLFPIIAVFCLSFFHFYADDYIGRPHSKVLISESLHKGQALSSEQSIGFSKADLVAFQNNPNAFLKEVEVSFKGGDLVLNDGKIEQRSPKIVYTKKTSNQINSDNLKYWDIERDMLSDAKSAILTAIQAIVPLCLFLYFVLKVVLKESVQRADEIILGIVLSIFGMGVFVMGITLGLTPLGGQLGANIPGAFTMISPWGLDGIKLPMFEGNAGKVLAAIFAFFLGYGATLAEPALNALGATVEKMTVGSFKKSLLMKTVAIGVGAGIALGIIKIAYNIPLEYLLCPPYLILLGLTVMSKESFVNFAWDSAGVTTGPITVPLVLAMGLGIGSAVPGVTHGFGVLALASVAPIISVLCVGIYVQNKSKKREKIEV